MLWWVSLDNPVVIKRSSSHLGNRESPWRSIVNLSFCPCSYRSRLCSKWIWKMPPVTEFILMGLAEQPKLQLPLFFLFLLNYMIIVVDNLCLMNLICLNSHLHNPMYFFVFNLSFIYLHYSSIFTLKMLMSFIFENMLSPLQNVCLRYFSSAFLSALSAMCWQPWPMITMWPSVSPCCPQWPCPLRCVLCWCLVRMWWGFLELWSTQGAWWGWTFVIPTSSTISCVTSSHFYSSPAAAFMPIGF